VKQLLRAGEAFEDLIFVGLERLPELGEEIKTAWRKRENGAVTNLRGTLPTR
jgi:hypothetical protein